LNEYSLQIYHKNKLDPEFKQRRSQANQRAYLKRKQEKSELKKTNDALPPALDDRLNDATTEIIESIPWRNSFRAVDDARMMEHYGITEPEIYKIYKLQLLREELKSHKSTKYESDTVKNKSDQKQQARDIR
jgi:hypothetical protein